MTLRLDIAAAKPFLSPSWNESLYCCDYTGQLFQVFCTRVDALLQDLRNGNPCTWRNNTYFVRQIENRVFDNEVRDISNALIQRGCLIRPTQLIECLKRCSAAASLYQKVDDLCQLYYREPLKVYVQPTSAPGGESNPLMGRIHISPECTSERALHVLLFELANLSQILEWHSIYQRATYGFLSRECFVEELLKREFNSTQICNQILAVAKSDDGLGPEWDIEEYEDVSFEIFREACQISGHVESYQSIWNRAFSPSYYRRQSTIERQRR